MTIESLSSEWSELHCIPAKPEKEFDGIWKWLIDHHRRKRDERCQKQEDGRSHNEYSNNIQELKEKNVSYKINEKPPKFIIALKQNKQLIEATVKTDKKEVKGHDVLVEYLIHNKIYLTCIPTKIVRHKTPLTFLDQAAKYTMSFVDATGEQYTFSHKTLSEILSGLRDLGYVFGDGAEGSLGTMVQAFKEKKLIEDNEDIDFTGFFIVNEKILPTDMGRSKLQVLTY